MIKNIFILIIIFLFTIPVKSLCEEVELLKLIQLQYNNISSFSGKFVQVSFKSNSDVIPKKGEGEVSYKRPGKMRWSYTLPEEQLLVTDGKKLWLFDPLLENVTIQKLEKVAGGTALSFLLGIGDLSNDFLTRKISNSFLNDRDGLIVEIVPKKINSNLAFIQLQVNPKSYNLKKILLMDRQGNYRTIELKLIKYNIYLEDELFEFKITKDMEVIEAD